MKTKEMHFLKNANMIVFFISTNKNTSVVVLLFATTDVFVNFYDVVINRRTD